jgi:hypothetical protein
MEGCAQGSAHAVPDIHRTGVGPALAPVASSVAEGVDGVGRVHQQRRHAHGRLHLRQEAADECPAGLDGGAREIDGLEIVVEGLLSAAADEKNQNG